MRQSQLFARTKKEPPKDAMTVSHKLLVRADFIDQLLSGVYSFLPLGWRVHQQIERIIREEIRAIGGQEVFLPVLQAKALWVETGRWDTIDPPLFKFKDRHGRELALGSTHEEVITDLVRSRVSSYAELPFSLYQIQDKFRNELRAQGGLLRVREFVMKDLYSFHRDEEDLGRFYKIVIEAYKRIFSRCGLSPIVVEASGGTIGGTVTNEFMIVADAGEDRIVLCKSCGWASNTEVYLERTIECPRCGAKLSRESSIEAGHIFSLGDTYSKKMNAWYTTPEGEKHPIIMGCYGIGLGRLMSAIIEIHHDENGMVWPEEVAPYPAHLIRLGGGEEVRRVGDALYTDLQKLFGDVLYDDRDETAGVKFADADLIGIPWRLVASEKTIRENSVEIKKRSEKESRLMKVKEVRDFAKNLYGIQ